jgi:hypothetical protein
MSDSDDVEKRRGFLRQVVGVGSALPLAGGITAGIPDAKQRADLIAYLKTL